LVELADLIEHIGDDVLDEALGEYEETLNATMRIARLGLRAERSARQLRPVSGQTGQSGQSGQAAS